MNIILIFECDREDIEQIERVHEYTNVSETIAAHATAVGDLVRVIPTLDSADAIEDALVESLEW